MSRPAVRPATKPAPKPKRAVRAKAKPKAKPKPKPAVRKKSQPAAHAVLPAVAEQKAKVDLVAAATPTGDGVSATVTLVILTSLALAIVSFGLASMPPRLLPRRTAYFVLERQAELIVLGIGLFIVVAFTFFWTRA